MKDMSSRIGMALAGLLMGGAACATEVYRTVGPDGVVTFTDEPPTRDAKPVKLAPIQVISPVAPPTAAASTAGTLQAGPDMTGGAPLSVSIVSPAPEETFRGAERTLPVSVRLDQPLPEGYGLLYLLDGSAQNDKATRALNFTLEGVERGEHLITVVTVDPRGREVGRSAPVIVHMKPPTVANVERQRAERDARRQQNQKPKPSPTP